MHKATVLEDDDEFEVISSGNDSSVSEISETKNSQPPPNLESSPDAVTKGKQQSNLLSIQFLIPKGISIDPGLDHPALTSPTGLSANLKEKETK
mmetsp:Transcript_13471/g.15693  ORF Transcript_13471/g.15693 Transcript_13471/m.15693 type:complete len:94 (+) Transcript_13471:1323-1604(+)